MSFVNCDRGKNVEEAVENLRCGLGRAGGKALAHRVCARAGQGAARPGLRYGAEGTDCQRRTEDAQVMVVLLIAEAGIPYLIETLKLVEVDRKTVGHDEPVKGDREPRLPKGIDLPGFAQNLCSGGNEKVLSVVGVNIIREQAFNRTRELPVESIDKDGFEDGPFEEDVCFSGRRIA